MKPVKHVTITGGAGQIAYQLLFRIAHGDLLGPDQPLALRILDLPDCERALEGVAMELEDCAFPLLKEIIIGSNSEEVFSNAEFAFLVGAKPRGPGMERKDLLAENGEIFVEQGRALNNAASRSVKVLVVGNPCNTNCLIAMTHAPDIPQTHFHAMTRLDQNRAVALLAKKASVPIEQISNMIIWGNHSNTQVPDVQHAIISKKSAYEAILDHDWLEEEFVKTVQQRGAAVINARGKSSAASAANAALDAMKALISPTRSGDCFSSGVISDKNPYGIAPGLIFSFPCHSKGDGNWEILSGLTLGDDLRKKLYLTEQELLGERDLVSDLLG